MSWPRWVYDEGTDPDPRFTLANERTFLAWIRTSIAFMAAGVAIDALPVPYSESVKSASGGGAGGDRDPGQRAWPGCAGP